MLTYPATLSIRRQSSLRQLSWTLTANTKYLITISIFRMDLAGFRNDRMCPHSKKVTVLYLSRATERNIRKSHQLMLKCLTQQGASYTVKRPRARPWDTRPKPAKKLRKSVTYWRVTSLSSKSTCSCPREKESWKLHGDTAFSALTMLTATKPNVFTRNKKKPRSSNSVKKISLTIEELAVSFKLNNPGVFFL